MSRLLFYGCSFFVALFSILFFYGSFNAKIARAEWEARKQHLLQNYSDDEKGWPQKKLIVAAQPEIESTNNTPTTLEPAIVAHSPIAKQHITNPEQTSSSYQDVIDTTAKALTVAEGQIAETKQNLSKQAKHFTNQIKKTIAEIEIPSPSKTAQQQNKEKELNEKVKLVEELYKKLKEKEKRITQTTQYPAPIKTQKPTPAPKYYTVSRSQQTRDVNSVIAEQYTEIPYVPVVPRGNMSYTIVNYNH